MSGPAVIVEDAHLAFPLVGNRARGIKEAFLAIATGRRATTGPRTFWAVRGVSLAVERGEVVGLIGRNGSGKSTLLRIIAGIYTPDRGSVRTTGRISSMLELGAGFRDELTGHENIRLSGAIMGYAAAEIDALTEPIIEFAGLEEFIRQPLRTYSSGMRSRLGFAVASAVQPDILLIDEALTVGDESFKQKSMARIEEMVARNDTAVVVVSHSTQELRRLCTRLCLLDHGRVISSGEPNEVIARYHALITAGASPKEPHAEPSNP